MSGEQKTTEQAFAGQSQRSAAMLAKRATRKQRPLLPLLWLVLAYAVYNLLLFLPPAIAAWPETRLQRTQEREIASAFATAYPEANRVRAEQLSYGYDLIFSLESFTPEQAASCMEDLAAVAAGHFAGQAQLEQSLPDRISITLYIDFNLDGKTDLTVGTFIQEETGEEQFSLAAPNLQQVPLYWCELMFPE